MHRLSLAKPLWGFGRITTARSLLTAREYRGLLLRENETGGKPA